MIGEMGDAPHHPVLQEIAEPEHQRGDDRNAHQRVDTEPAEQHQRDEHAEHQDFAVGEIHDADNTEDGG